MYCRTIAFVSLVILGIASCNSPLEPNCLKCCISTEAKSCRLGGAPSIKVRIENIGDDTIQLVRSLDGSEYGSRYPHCYFEVIGPDGKSPVKRTLRCGNQNPLEKGDFVEVKPGETFDPFAGRLQAESFRQIGEYRIRLIYSTQAQKIDSWLGDGEPNRALQKLLDCVPKTTVESNEIKITITK